MATTTGVSNPNPNTQDAAEKKLSHMEPLESERYVPRAMPNILGSWDMTALFIIILFFVTNVPTAVAGGAAGLSLWVIGGIAFFVPCAIATAQLGLMYPYEGSLYNWTHKAFGGYMSFFVAFCAWLPSFLLILATSDLAVSCFQSLNPKWLVQPWQQGLVLMLLVAFSGVIAVQRHRMVQNMINAVVAFILLAVVIVFIAGIVWLLKGNPSAANFRQVGGWNPFSGGTIGLFGVITLGYLGVNIPFNMAGELVGDERERSKAIRRPLLWGTLIVLTSYLLVTFAVLVVQGQSGANSLFSMVQVVQMVLGTFAGDIVNICILATLFVATIAYNNAYARFLMIGGIDKRLPMGLGKLNRNRAPARAILFQTILAIVVSAILFLVIPYVGIIGGQPANVALESYFVVVGTATIVWAFATIFLFVDIFRLYARNPKVFRAHRILPIPVLLFFSVLGLFTGLAAIVDTLFNSYIPPLIPNNTWLLVVSGFTVIILIGGAIGSMLGSSEAAFQDLNIE